jgi:urea transport system ATP-binding protein
MLQIQQLNQFYGGSHILRNVSFEVPAGKLTTLLGRNGVGKTTLLKCLMGVVPTASGAIDWEGRAIQKLPAYERVSQGLAYVPQGREIFPRLTVEENLLIGAAARRAPSKVPDSIYALFPVLKEMKGRRGC